MRVSIERIWAVVPVPVLVLDRLPGRLVGLSLGLVVLVRRDYAADRPTMVHELEHCKQFWRGGVVVHMLRYYLDAGYRMRSEVQAFQAELLACHPDRRDDRLDEAARSLATGYHLGLDVDDCRELLECYPPSAASWMISRPDAVLPSTSSPPVTARSTDSTGR